MAKAICVSALAISGFLMATSAWAVPEIRVDRSGAGATLVRYDEHGYWIGDHRYFDDQSGYERAQQKHSGGAGHSK